jgi:hypothetical protein
VQIKLSLKKLHEITVGCQQLEGASLRLLLFDGLDANLFITDENTLTMH